MSMKIKLFVLIGLSNISSSFARQYAIPLNDCQRILRTGLDDELSKITEIVSIREETHSPDRVALYSKRRSNVRTRSEMRNREGMNSLSLKNESFHSADDLWKNILDHGWHIVNSIKRLKERGLTKASSMEEVSPCPFLICIQEVPGQERHTLEISQFQNILASFNKTYEESLLIKSTHNETCVILTVTARDTHDGAEKYVGDHRMVIMPLVDVMKIHSGTIDEVSSKGWAVPFDAKINEIPSSYGLPANLSQTLNQWERVITVDFVPGIGGMKEEAMLLEVVNNIMNDIQDMGEVGWLQELNDEELQDFIIDDKLAGIPSLSEMFSLTAALDFDVNGEVNPRIQFWKDSLQNGIESEHACSEMFSKLFVKPRAGYFGYDLILNPNDGPPPTDYESSASNPACITSLIAGLSVHPFILSVKANFPVYHGWNVAQTIDSFLSL